MSLGTSADGKPWVCEVHYAYDDDLNLYFRSKPDTRHCQEIDANPNVAGNIVTQHFLNQLPRGVYVAGTAARVADPRESDAGVQCYAKRFGHTSATLLADMQAKGSVLYKISVTDVYLFDAYVSKPSQKYHLALHSGS